MNEAWIGLIGALGGVAVTALAGLATAWLTLRGSQVQEQRKSERARRRELQEVYVSLLLAAQRFYAHVSTLDVPGMSDVGDEKRFRARMSEMVDSELKTALEEAGTRAQLLSGEQLHEVLAAFFTDILDEALTVAFTGRPAHGGYDHLAKPLLRTMRAELADKAA